MFADRDYNKSSAASRARPSVSMVRALLWVTIAVFLLQWIWTRPDGYDPVTGALCLHAEAIRHGQLWRLLTYIFVHGGLLHIAFNMWGLFVFGRVLEPHLGRWRFLALYLVSGLIGGGLWLLLNWNGGVPVVGASGSLFGVMMATAMLFPNVRIMLLIPPVPMKLKTFVAVFAVIEVVSELGTSIGGWRDGIAHVAHLGGLLGGFLFMQQYMPRYSLRGLFPRIPNPFRRKWKLHESARPPATAGADSPEESMAGVDRVLDKIGREGIGSLTTAEQRILERARERLRQR